MKKFLVLAGVLFAVWMCARPAPAGRWSGRPGTVTVQTSTGISASRTREGLTYVPLARFAVQAVVLARERYFNDKVAKLAPVDLALGWGPMSEARVINSLQIYQDHRWYQYSWPDMPPIDAGEIARCSANMHMIPADGAVRAEVLKLKRTSLSSCPVISSRSVRRTAGTGAVRRRAKTRAAAPARWSG